MPTYARIEHGLVAEVMAVNGSIGGRFHSDLHWIEVPVGVSPVSGWNWNGTTFTPPASSAGPQTISILQTLQNEISALQVKLAAIATPQPPASGKS